jgi:hypothetical protein
MITMDANELPRFMVCNGSRKLSVDERHLEQLNNKPRDEGIAAHYMASKCFRCEYTLDELVDRKAPNGVYMTSEMAEHVRQFLDLRNVAAPPFRDIEVNTSHDFSPIWAITGKADLCEIDARCDIHIIDFRYGWRIVEPERNWTLISHAIGFVKNHSVHPHTVIHLSIFQPRPNHPLGPLRTWKITLGTLELLNQELTQSLCSPSDQLQTSSHCGQCPAITNCPAARKAEMNAIDAIDTVYEDTLDNAQLSFNLDMLNRASTMIETRLKAFEELAKHRIKAGEIVDNYAIEMGLGNSKWKDGIDASILKAITGKDLSKPKLVTPAEAKRQGVDEITIKALSERPPIGLKLIRVNADAKATKMFGEK